MSGTIGTVDCSAQASGEAIGRGTLLSGTILDKDLADVAEIRGVTVTSADGAIWWDPSGAQPADPGDGTARANPLDAHALQVVNADLTGVLRIPVDTGTGAYGQYGRAQPNAKSAGAAGLVGDSGAIDLNPTPGHARPQLATLSVSGFVAGAGLDSVSEVIQDLTDATLRIGAVAATAELDGCEAPWADEIYRHLSRDYFIAGIETDLTSPLVAQIGTDVADTASTLDTTLTNLEDDAGLKTALATILTGSINVLGLAALGTPTIGKVGLDTNLAAVTDLVTSPINLDRLGTVSIPDGTARIDLASLLGPAYGASDGLNGLPPNTELLINTEQTNPLTTSLSGALINGLAPTINEALDAAIAAVDVTIALSVPVSVSAPVIGTVSVGSVDVTIAHLLAAESEVTGEFNRSTCDLGGLLCSTVDGLVTALLGNGIVDSLLGAVSGAVPDLAGTVTTAVSNASDDIVPHLDETLLEETTGTIPKAIDGVSKGLTGLFGAGGLLSLTVNNQNAPDPALIAPTSPEPSWSTAMPGRQHSPYRTGRFDISALRLVAAGSLLPAGVLSIDLARASVGPNGPGPGTPPGDFG